MSPENLTEALREKKRLDAYGYRDLLTASGQDVTDMLAGAAREVAVRRFGHGIYIRGLIEITNICRNDCLYCGIRKSNTGIPRYRLSFKKILECCGLGYSLGFRTFVLQGGELPDSQDDSIEDMCTGLRSVFPDCAITLSLGERSDESYRRFFRAGADRYLLRHETHNQAHYSCLHPKEMSLAHRLHCLEILKETGYQTGTGIMVGSPFQTVDNIVEDILFIQDFRPEMIGLGPFIPHKDTVFAGWTPDNRTLELTLRLISIFRLMFPDALIPATTALSTLVPDGRELGILAGANVVMPNLSPASVRESYSLYDGKASSGAEAAEGLEELKSRLDRIRYHISAGRGDYVYTG